jgi:hypothetical protein
VMSSRWAKEYIKAVERFLGPDIRLMTFIEIKVHQKKELIKCFILQ